MRKDSCGLSPKNMKFKITGEMSYDFLFPKKTKQNFTIKEEETESMGDRQLEVERESFWATRADD
jgi:hypothetical protein